MANINEIMYRMGVDTGNSVSEIDSVKGALNQLDSEVTQTSTNAEKLAQTLEFGSAVAGGIAAVQGAMGLLGIENEKAMKTLTRLMQLQAVAGGLQQGANLLLKDNIVITKLKIFWMKIRVAWMNKVITTQAAMTMGLSLLVAGLVAGISAMKRQSESTDENTDSLNENADAVKDAADEWRKYNDVLNENADIVNHIEMVNGQFQKTQSTGLAQLERELKWLSASGATKLQQLAKEKQIIKERMRLNADAMLLETDQVKFLRKEKDMQTELDINALEQKKERERLAVEQRKQSWVDESETMKLARRENNDIELLAKQNHNDALVKATKDSNKLLEKENKRMDKADADRSARQRQRDFEDNQMRLGIATNTINGLMSLGELLGKEGENMAQYQKTLALFQIAVDTASAISSAVKTGSAVGLTPLEKGLAISGNIALVLGNMAKAKQIISSVGDAPKLNGGGSATVPSLSIPNTGGSISGANINPDETGTSIPEIIVPGQINERNGNSGRVYVLESDIRETMNDVAFVETVSTF